MHCSRLHCGLKLMRDLRGPGGLCHVPVFPRKHPVVQSGACCAHLVRNLWVDRPRWSLAEHIQSTSGDSRLTDLRGVSSSSPVFSQSPLASLSGINGFATLISIRCSSISSTGVPSGTFDSSRLFSASKYKAQKCPSWTAQKPSHPPSVSLRSCRVQSKGTLKFGSAQSLVPNLTS